MDQLKIFRAEFKPINPVGGCLIIAADNLEEANNIAMATITHTNVFTVEEVVLEKSKVIEYLSGDY